MPSFGDAVASTVTAAAAMITIVSVSFACCSAMQHCDPCQRTRPCRDPNYDRTDSNGRVWVQEASRISAGDGSEVCATTSSSFTHVLQRSGMPRMFKHPPATTIGLLPVQGEAVVAPRTEQANSFSPASTKLVRLVSAPVKRIRKLGSSARASLKSSRGHLARERREFR
jgi:hypothetical protein